MAGKMQNEDVKVLLLNDNYQPMGFVSYYKAFKLWIKGKVEIISEWENYNINTPRHTLKIPSVIKLSYRIRWVPRKANYSDLGVYRRDNNICQYCSKKLTTNNRTIDHVIPRSKGGKTCWTNCVTSCPECNSKKSNKFGDDIKMLPMNSPRVPLFSVSDQYTSIHPKASDWSFYLGI